MLIATLDYPVPRADIAALAFDAPDPLSVRCDVVIWQPMSLVEAFSPTVERVADGRPILGLAGSERLLARARQWREAFRALLGHGGTLVVFVPPALQLGVHTLQEVVGFDLLEPLPGPPVARATLPRPEPPVAAAGQPFREFFDHTTGMLRAHAALEAAIGRIVATTADGRPCASYAYGHPGRLLLLPAPASDADMTTRERLCDAIIALVHRLRAAGSPATLHPSAASFVLADEMTDRERASRLAREQARIAAEMAVVRRRLERVDFVKQLVAGDARGAVAAAAFVLHALGAHTQTGLADEDTVVFEHAGCRCALVIATDRSAGPAHWIARAAAAVARWSQGAGDDTRAALLDCRENDVPRDKRTGPSAALREAAARAALPLLSGDALLQAYESRDAGVLDRLIGA
jgi:hypothetical protein